MRGSGLVVIVRDQVLFAASVSLESLLCFGSVLLVGLRDIPPSLSLTRDRVAIQTAVLPSFTAPLESIAIASLFLLFVLSFKLQETYSSRVSADMNLSCKGAVAGNIPKTSGSCNPGLEPPSCTESPPQSPAELRLTHQEVV